jgi:hypothetical protein
VQFPPEAADLLAAVARLLDEQVLGAVPPHLQHQVRVAAHLSHLVERELRLGPQQATIERALLTELLGVEVDDPATTLAARLRAGDEPDLEAKAWPVLVEIARHDVAVAKPGHDSWEGE